MSKIEVIKSCDTCSHRSFKHYALNSIDGYMICDKKGFSIEYVDVGKIHRDCPFEDEVKYVLKRYETALIEALVISTA